jgi:Flp pilus assembly pilin Flp
MAVKRIKKKKEGQSLAEWALVIALISIVCVSALTQWGKSLNTTTNEINNALNSVNTNINTTT